MKKLVFGLVAVLATVAAQAAYVDWQYETFGTANWGNSKTDAANGYTAYLLTAANWDSIKDSVSGTSAIAAKATDSSTLIFEKSGKGNYYYSTHADGSQVAGVRQVEAASGNYYVILANDDGYSVVVDNVSITAYNDPTASGTGQTPGITKTSQSQSAILTPSSSYSGGSSGVPEPTSGLLLVLGGAMLALRRRRA